MVIEMFVFESNEAFLDLFRSRVSGRKSPLAVGGDACTQQFLVPVRHYCGVGDMKKGGGEDKRYNPVTKKARIQSITFL